MNLYQLVLRSLLSSSIVSVAEWYMFSSSVEIFGFQLRNRFQGPTIFFWGHWPPFLACLSFPLIAFLFLLLHLLLLFPSLSSSLFSAHFSLLSRFLSSPIPPHHSLHFHFASPSFSPVTLKLVHHLLLLVVCMSWYVPLCPLLIFSIGVIVFGILRGFCLSIHFLLLSLFVDFLRASSMIIWNFSTDEE